MGERVQLKVQENAQGFGHAVFCAHDYVGDEPFLLVLGDHLYRSTAEGRSCASQIIDVYDRFNQPVVALHPTRQEHVHRFGVITGTWIDESAEAESPFSPLSPAAAVAAAEPPQRAAEGSLEGRLLRVAEIVEKPTLERARATLSVQGLVDVRGVAL